MSDARETDETSGTAAWHGPIGDGRIGDGRIGGGGRPSGAGRIEHVRGDALTGDTAQTAGMRRLEAISGRTVGSERLWMGRTHVGPATSSGDHHHGEAETAIYVVSGHPVFVFAEGDREVRIETGPGDYVFVPPYVPHREENPSADEEAVVVIARSTQEGIVVNLPSLWAGVERPGAE
ncbi:cupin domain-containing protein [Spirillospora sp. NPDC049652]